MGLRAAGLMLVPDTPFRMWHTDQFLPMLHHVPIARDLSDMESWYRRLEANETVARNIFKQGLRRAEMLYQWSALSCYLCGVFRRYAKLFEQRGGAVGKTCAAPQRLCRPGQLPPTSRDKTFSSKGWTTHSPMRCV